MNLLIDIGNTTIKIAEAIEYNSLQNFHRVNYEKKLFHKIVTAIFDTHKGTYSQIGISSVVPEVTKLLIPFIKKKYKHNPILVERDITSILNFNYYSGNLGSDRISIAVAARAMFSNRNILIFDFGTATTANFITAKVFRGGLIMPGFKTSLTSLISSTALPEVALSIPDKKNLYFNTTEDNIFYGAYLQTLYSVQRLIEVSRLKYNDLLVVITGGNAKYFLNYLNYDLYDSLLSLKGICIILEQYGTVKKK
ncbi:MAG: type III pantothenate kinase [Ignavibacteria bacterium]